MDNKYYTPSIEELRIGLEYERLGTKDGEVHWYPLKFGLLSDTVCIVDLSMFPNYLINDLPNMRVKHLDKDDIESLGWCKEDWAWDGDYYKISNYRLYVYNDQESNNKIKVKSIVPILEDMTIRESSITHFYGVVNNKSELKVVMKQIGIIMNYKKLDKEELLKIINSAEFDKLTDEEAFTIMQRYNELNDVYIENDTFKNIEFENITINIIEDK